jgi:hypothetical protein
VGAWSCICTQLIDSRAVTLHDTCTEGSHKQRQSCGRRYFTAGLWGLNLVVTSNSLVRWSTRQHQPLDTPSSAESSRGRRRPEIENQVDQSHMQMIGNTARRTTTEWESEGPLGQLPGCHEDGGARGRGAGGSRGRLETVSGPSPDSCRCQSMCCRGACARVCDVCVCCDIA